MRRMEDKIRKLCAQIAAAQGNEEVAPTLLELQDALHQHIAHLRSRLADYPLVVERRARNGMPTPDIPAPENQVQENAKGEHR